MSDSREAAKNAKGLDVEELSAVVVDAAFHLHKELGPGLLESVYEIVLAKALSERGLDVQRQKPVPIVFAGCRFEEGFRDFASSREPGEPRRREKGFAMNLKPWPTWFRESVGSFGVYTEKT